MSVYTHTNSPMKQLLTIAIRPPTAMFLQKDKTHAKLGIKPGALDQPWQSYLLYYHILVMTWVFICTTNLYSIFVSLAMIALMQEPCQTMCHSEYIMGYDGFRGSMLS